MLLLFIVTFSAPAHAPADYNSDGGNQVGTIAPNIFARENFASHCTSASRPEATDALASPLAKTARLPARDEGAGGERADEGAGGESLSFLGGKRDGDADLSLGLDFSVGTFAGGAARVAVA